MVPYKFDNNTSFNEYDEYVLDWTQWRPSFACNARAGVGGIREAHYRTAVVEQARHCRFVRPGEGEASEGGQRAATGEKGDFGVYVIGLERGLS